MVDVKQLCRSRDVKCVLLIARRVFVLFLRQIVGATSAVLLISAAAAEQPESVAVTWLGMVAQAKDSKPFFWPIGVFVSGQWRGSNPYDQSILEPSVERSRSSDIGTNPSLSDSENTKSLEFQDLAPPQNLTVLTPRDSIRVTVAENRRIQFSCSDDIVAAQPLADANAIKFAKKDDPFQEFK